jgi:hypothetical protein
VRLVKYFYGVVEQYKIFTDDCSRIQILPVSQTMRPTQGPRQILLPDLLSATPFESGINPHYDQVAAESSAWITSLDIFSKNRRVVLSLNYGELLAAYVYPCVFIHMYSTDTYSSPSTLCPIRYASPERLRMACDFVSPRLPRVFH